jgi:ubiquinone/menaquinone biosynthesis C-methylase UbiE
MRRLSLARIWTPKLYGRIAPLYDRVFGFFFPIGTLARERVVEGLCAGSILDVGCGTGALLALAHANGLECFGIDTSLGMLGQAKRKMPRVNLHKASFYAIPYADKSFDYVVETNAVSGVGIDARRVVSEMVRVCRTGGQVRVADYAEPGEEQRRHKFLKELGVLLGDYPQDYRGLFRELGYEAEVEILGGHGMYQLIKVLKRS